ncbi:alpha/beta hydrolase [Candidatus Bathyarchaeota archaeon]|nr:alpha/beta hydrolase [Candidatus Bathyarchaeota archaeon]MBT7186831.1 alpha/beta hydrolase [Candidatus Bathyarchaeota archaeon]MBT7347910.1 alpha/beta hydrolase [Candidatus Bathyarchaeota archaeon]
MLTEKRYQNKDINLNYAEGPNAGPPVLFLHGLTDRWQFFLPVMPTMTQNWHVYALDFRGHGASKHTPPYRYLDHINDTISFIKDVIGEPVHLYGTALGGMAALMVAARRPDLVKSLVFGDANIKLDYVRKVIVDYHTFWSGWHKLASYPAELDDYVKMVSNMPINIPWREPGTYGDGLDYVSVLNKALYLRNLDPEVVRAWSESAEDDAAFKTLTTGYDEDEIRNIQCSVLFIQANKEKGGILADDEVKFALERVKRAQHIYMPMYGHNLGCYSWETGALLRAVNTFLMAHR